MPREASENQWIALISKVAPFSYLEEEELVEIADSFTWFTALGGSTLIRPDDPSASISSSASRSASSAASDPARWSARWG
jgi:hypothetical protein